MKYTEAVEYIESLQQYGIVPGLGNIRNLCGFYPFSFFGNRSTLMARSFCERAHLFYFVRTLMITCHFIVNSI